MSNSQISNTLKACPSSPIWMSPSQLTSKDLEESSDVKPAAFGESEELAEEQDQRQDAEDDRQDHSGLNRLQPFWGKKHLVKQAWEWGMWGQGRLSRQSGGNSSLLHFKKIIVKSC